MWPALETAPFRDPGTTRPASRARPLPFHCPSPPSRTASWATPVRPCLPPVKAQPVHRRQDGRNAEPAALFPPAQLPNSLPGAVACPLSPPSFLPDILPGGTPRLDGIIPFGGPLGRIGPACRACTAPGFQLPFPSLPRGYPAHCPSRAARSASPSPTPSLASIPRGMGLRTCATGPTSLSMATAPDRNARGRSISMPPGECRARLPTVAPCTSLPSLPYGPTRQTGLQRPVQPQTGCTMLSSAVKFLD